MAGEAHLVPFRTQKLSPRAPMVLRSKSVGEQDVADQQGTFFCWPEPAEDQILCRFFTVVINMYAIR